MQQINQHFPLVIRHSFGRRPSINVSLFLYPRTFSSHNSGIQQNIASMSEKHLKAGQPLPPLKDGSVRLFSMKYCTFSQRSRLVLKAKGINYEEINCSLTKKPEFLLERNPDGKVPVYEHNGEVLVGSSIICDYLDEIYPDPPLYPKDPLQKAKDKFVMETYDSKVSSIFHKFMTSGGEDEEAKIIAGLTLFDAELKKRGTPFFGGQQPGMVDYSTWPWNERLMVSDKLMNTLKAKLPDLDAYFQRMLTTPAVKAILNSKEQYQKFFESFISGQPLPPLKDGSVRLFSMKYCPFAQRSRLVLKAKGINYEEINCNLKKKPEFLLERHPDGKVPVFEHNGKVLIESSIICDYLDEIYPDPPLYPKDPFQKAKDKVVMETYASKVIPAFYKAMGSGGQDNETATNLIAALTLFDAELKKRGTPFFGGQQPSMVDYITWPWNERLMVSDKLMNTLKAELPDLDAYFQRMLTTPAVKAILNSKEQYQKYHESSISGNPQYDL